MRTSSAPFGTLDKLCPLTFNSLGELQLHCVDFFGQPNLQIINKNFPLLSDGRYIYIIGKKIHSQKVSIEQKQKKTEKKEKKKETEKESESIVNICNFILYEFDIEETNQKRESIRGSYFT